MINERLQLHDVSIVHHIDRCIKVIDYAMSVIKGGGKYLFLYPFVPIFSTVISYWGLQLGVICDLGNYLLYVI